MYTRASLELLTSESLVPAADCAGTVRSSGGKTKGGTNDVGPGWVGLSVPQLDGLWYSMDPGYGCGVLTEILSGNGAASGNSIFCSI